VGAVVVRDGEIVGEGYHERPGEPHAEVAALADAGQDAGGATLYVTLEPCNHHGRTPPCTEAIIEAGIERVIIAVEDPCCHDCESGQDRLRAVPLEVITGVERNLATALNSRYFLASREARPMVIAKSARTLDGRTMLPGRTTLAVTGREAHEEVGRRRSEVDAMLVGSGTILADDPRLNARRADGTLFDRQPIRVIADRRLRTSPGARVVTSPGGPVVVLTAPGMLGTDAAEALGTAGVEVIGVEPDRLNGLDPRGVLDVLYRKGISGIMVEGGGALLASLASADLVDHWEIWIAPTVTGAGGGMLQTGLDVPLQLGAMRVWEFGEDLLVRALPSAGTEPAGGIDRR
jgi:diaminohydroxyphosphoribosylaminopyrimidine deaminase/5-amino-6-(5-phosphoribosylamino)uracil reductase